jgi:SAM-dependent methyltransferase
VLTVDFDRFEVHPGCRLLDLGCGQGRHAFEARRRGARVVALDREAADCKDTAGMLAAMAAEERLREAGAGWAVNGDGLALPFADASFDRIVAAEVLEHVRDDGAAIAELVAGGHVRVYRRRQLVGRLRAAGLHPLGAHHAHALHAPYWWLKCAVGVGNEESHLVQAYHRFLVADIVRPRPVVRAAERALNPLVGKSLVVYLERPC